MPTLKTAMNRRYGFEIENSELSHHANDVLDGGFRLTYDSSVEHDCACGCDTCDHDCNCSQCEINYYDEQHCEDEACMGNELVSRRLNQPLTDEQRQTLKYLAAGVSDHSLSDSYAGMHIHVEARDLSLNQIQTVIRLWGKLVALDHHGIWRGREANQYCKHNTENHLRHNYDKMLQVNISNIVSIDSYADIVERKFNADTIDNLDPYDVGTDTHKSTIEFRGFAPTFDPDIIQYRVDVCRQIVEYASKNFATYWLGRATTLTEFFRELES